MACDADPDKEASSTSSSADDAALRASSSEADVLSTSRGKFGADILSASAAWRADGAAFVTYGSLLDVRVEEDAMRVRHEQTGLAVRVSLLDAAPDVDRSLSASDDILIQRAGIENVSHRFIAPTDAGVEDFVVADKPLRGGALRYVVELEKVRSVRFVSGVVEFLDSQGAPRIRIAEPFVVDATGTKRAASLRVEGCSFDENPAFPFGRRHPHPSSSACEIAVHYDVNLQHPVLIDPEWQATAVMQAPRTHHTASVMADGTVFVAGGFDASDVAVVATEVLCPEALPCGGVPFFAIGPNMPNPRGHHSETYLPAVNKVLIAGGKVSRASTTALTHVNVYDTATGVFETPLTMSSGRFAHTSTLLNDGRVLLAGGEDGTNNSSAQVFSPSPASLGAAIPLAANKHRRFHVAESLGPANSRVLLAGGLGTLGAEQSAELFDSATNTFTALQGVNSQLSAVRVGATATLLEDGRVLIVGGKNTAGLYSQTIDLFQPNGAAGTFVQTNVSMTNARAFHGAVKLVGEGKVLITGGVQGTTVLDEAEVFDQTLGDFIDPLSTTLKKPRNFHSATRLSSGKALVIGGGVAGPADNPGIGAVLDFVASAQAEVLALRNGDPCDEDGECLSNNCYQKPNGICCSDACTDVCSTCFQADQKFPTADSQGICLIVEDNTPINEQCESGVELVLTCVDGNVNVAGVSACEPYVCEDEADCRLSCSNDTHCHEDYYCANTTCIAREANGFVCDRDRQCDTDECVDGFCCTSACDGICEACDNPGSGGTCSQVTGDPHGDRGPCPGENGCVGTCGDALNECDYDNTQVCSAASCVDGVQSSGLCGAEGTCDDGTLECGDYACDGEGERCLETCSSNDECVGDAICRVDGVCAVVEAASCANENTLTNPDGSTTECGAFKCDANKCLERCDSIDDCADGLVCDAASQCVDAPADPAPVEECSTSAASLGTGTRGAMLPLLGLLALGLGLRRRSERAIGGAR